MRIIDGGWIALGVIDCLHKNELLGLMSLVIYYYPNLKLSYPEKIGIGTLNGKY